MPFICGCKLQVGAPCIAGDICSSVMETTDAMIDSLSHSQESHCLIFGPVSESSGSSMLLETGDEAVLQLQLSRSLFARKRQAVQGALQSLTHSHRGL